MGILTRDKTTDPPPPVSRRKSRVGEISTSWVHSFTGGIRTLRRSFWPTTPSYVGTKISYDLTRQLYRNDNKTASLGAGFARRIINSTVDFMELPRAASGDEIVDEFLNKCIGVYWRGEIQQMLRDACRDADTVVRVKRHDPNNKLVSAEEWESCYLEIIPPERCGIYYKQNGDKWEIEIAYVRHETDEIIQSAIDSGRSLMQPQVRQHVIIEEITPERFRYWDETEGKWLDELEQANAWGFVNLVEVHNEYDSALEGGQSDFESCLPFIMAFHDVMGQSLIAHKAHSIPKAKFKVHDMTQFIANNWPDSFDHDEFGQPVLSSFSGNISWKGTEVFFMEAEEDAEYMEVKSALGDSKTLLDFLLVCIAISSETPKSILMDQTAQDADEMIPFSKKINRKRGFFTDPIQRICKMVLSINLMEPVKVPLTWDEITPDIALKKAQVLQQDVMSLEVAATRQVVSDRTMREHLRSSIPSMKSPQQEAQDAKKNVALPQAGPTSTEATKGSDSGNSKTTGNQN